MTALSDAAPTGTASGTRTVGAELHDDESWMPHLGLHYRAMGRRYPDDELVIVFDIDGAIIDTRHLVRRVLLDYDVEHDTELFRNLVVTDIDVHEGAIARLLDRWPPTATQRADVLEHYEDQMWSPAVTLAAHQPYRG